MLDMKESNKQTILWTLCSCKTSTVKDLSRLTSLSYATTANILNDFVNSGEVILGEMLSTTGGRPSQSYTFNADYGHVLALSTKIVKGKHIIYACVGNLYGEIVYQTEQSFDNIHLISFEIVIDSLLRAYPTISILSFSLPGVERDGIIVTNDYIELQGVSFRKHFQEKYNLPVTIENDVNAAVLGYGTNIEDDSIIVGIYFPKYFGPGAGIMIDGKVLKGNMGFAGEISLLPLDIDWLSMDYKNPNEIGPAISKLISVFCGIINPKDIVLYGDFFTEAVKKSIKDKVSAQVLGSILPTIVYQKDLDSDIITGLLTQGVSTYQSELTKK